MRSRGFWGFIIGALLVGIAFVALGKNEYYYFAAYVILQSLIMAVAWNILGGFTGYVNFGAAGFFAVAAYTTIALNKYLQGLGLQPPMLVYIAAGAVVCGLIGLGTGYLTLRLRGVYFAIATLALAVVFQTLANNWDYVGGAKGSYILTPAPPPFFSSYIKYLFFVMLLLSRFAIIVSRYIVHSKFGRGLAAVRDDEVAAECMGVPTLRLKLISTTVMGVLMGMAGAPYPFYVTYVDPQSAFSLGIAVNAIAMPMIGGTAYWCPVIGAIC
jgi:branched-chain amino acid transport system permease protein